MIMNLYAISLYLLISCLTSVNADFPTASNKSYFGVIKHFQSGSCFHAVDKKIVLVKNCGNASQWLIMISIFGLIQLRDPSLPSISFASDCLSTNGSEVIIADPPAKKFIVPGLADIIGTNKPSEIVSDEGQCLYSLDNSTVLADKCGSAVSPDSDPGRFFTFPSSQDLFQYLLP